MPADDIAAMVDQVLAELRATRIELQQMRVKLERHVVAVADERELADRDDVFDEWL